VSAIRIFISYSHESDQHLKDVLNLARQLRSDGIDATVDVYIEAPPEGWPRWVERQIREADFVLCVCSELYKKGFEGRNDGHKGLGVNQEGFVILQDLYEAANCSSKYIPVSFSYIGPVLPIALRSFSHYELPGDYDKLFRRLTNQRLVVPPPLGELRLVPPADDYNPLPQKSEGFTESSRITAHISPSQYPIEQLAPAQGFYLSRIINPQEEGGLTTVWLAARGPFDYFADSIRIRHTLGRGFGGGSPPVAVSPDADYKITHSTGCDAVYPLIPALVVGTATRSWAWFTLSTTRDNQPVLQEEATTKWLHYHVSDGRQGTIVLDVVPPFGARLAKIIGSDVVYTWPTLNYRAMASMVITPEGLQRGLEQGSSPAADYSLVGFSSTISENRVIDDRRKIAFALEARAGLNGILRKPTLRAKLLEWFSEGSVVAADLIGGLADEWATRQLMGALETDRRSIAIFGLAVRHFASGDDVLADVLFNRADKLTEHEFDEIVAALVIRPAASREKLLSELKRRKYWVAAAVENTLVRLDAVALSYGSLPQAGPLEVDLYLSGSMNSWSHDESAKLHYTSGGVYQSELQLAPGFHRIKIRGNGWKIANFGTTEDSPPLEPGQTRVLFFGPLSSDIVLRVDRQATYLFQMTGYRIDTMTLSFNIVSRQ
jgi:hypothetical protein